MVIKDVTDRMGAEAAAGDWLARLDRGADETVRAQFERWRASDPRHAAAYARLEATWQQLDRVRALRPGEGSEDPDFLLRSSVLAAPAIAPPARRSAGTSIRRHRWLAAASVLLAVATFVLALPQWRGTVYSTGLGGFQRVVLNDGSVVQLNTDTRVRVRFAAGLRRIELLKGEANFKVARDPRRPFVVAAGETAVRALGTRFNVRRSLDTVEVIVTEGKVAVGATGAVEGTDASVLPPSAPVVGAGQSAIAGAQGLKLSALSDTVSERKLAWQGGMLAFEGDTLRAVVAEFNRYNEKQLVIEDEVTAAFRVGGYFTPTNLEAFVAVLQSKLGVRAETHGTRIVLRGAPGKGPEKIH